LVLRLRHACGLSERRIALAVGLSRSTVKSHVERAAAAGIAWPVLGEIDDAALERTAAANSAGRVSSADEISAGSRPSPSRSRSSGKSRIPASFAICSCVACRVPA
jgi:hypothetical protein